MKTKAPERGQVALSATERRNEIRAKQDQLLAKRERLTASIAKLRLHLTEVRKQERDLRDVFAKLTEAVDLGHKKAKEARDGGTESIADQLRRCIDKVLAASSVLAGQEQDLARVERDIENVGEPISEERERQIMNDADALVASLSR